MRTNPISSIFSIEWVIVFSETKRLIENNSEMIGDPWIDKNGYAILQMKVTSHLLIGGLQGSVLVGLRKPFQMFSGCF